MFETRKVRDTKLSRCFFVKSRKKEARRLQLQGIQANLLLRKLS